MTYCMSCGMIQPPDVANKDFIGWECPDCRHHICKACMTDIRSTTAEPVCFWWNCPSNIPKKVKVVTEYSKPKEDIVFEPKEEKGLGQIIGVENEHLANPYSGSDFFVEVMSGRNWIPVLCTSFEVVIENNPIAMGTSRFKTAYFTDNPIGHFSIILTNPDMIDKNRISKIRAISEIINGTRQIFTGEVISHQLIEDRTGTIRLNLEARQLEVDVTTPDESYKEYLEGEWESIQARLKTDPHFLPMTALPEPSGMDDLSLRSRKEKPPRTALRPMYTEIKGPHVFNRLKILAATAIFYIIILLLMITISEVFK